MPTSKQIEANRENSKKSTGPKTLGGKATVSKNATKHGLLSDETILVWEDGASFEQIRKDLFDSLQPHGGLENILVDRILSLTWRLRRATRTETGTFYWKRYGFFKEGLQATINEGLEELSKVIEHLPSDEVGEIKSMFGDTVIKMKIKNNPQDSLELFGVFKEAGEVLNNLHRYEIGLERSLFKTIHELQRIQAYRLGKNVSVPIAVDINSDGHI